MNIKSIKTLSSITFQLFLFLGSFSLIWFFIGEQDLLWQVLLSLILYLIISVVIPIAVRTVQEKRTFLRSILAIFYIVSMVFGCFVLYIFYNTSSVQIPPGRIIFGDNFTISGGEELNDDLVVFGGNVVVTKDADLNGSLVVFGGAISSDGNVSGDVVVFGGQIQLDNNAVVHGDVVTFGGQLERTEGATVMGEVVNNFSPNFESPNGQIPPVPPPEASNNTVSAVLLVTTALTALISAISGAIAQFAAHKKSLADIEIEKQKLALERDKFELEKSKSQPKRKSKKS